MIAHLKSRPIVFWVLLGLMFVYEGWAIASLNGTTISEITWGLAAHPIVPFLVGIVAGHFFWQRDQ